MRYALGLDLGGTNVKALAVTVQGRVLAETSVPTASPATGRWLDSVQRAVTRIRRQLRQAPEWIGVAAPGLPARDGLSIDHLPERLPGLERMRWQRVLKTKERVPVLNDAQAALLGETWRGAARRGRNVMLLTLGTGVGGAALVDGRLLHGHLGRAGHLGHITLNPDGLRDIVNTPGSLEDAIGDCTILTRSGGRYGSTRELVTAFRRGRVDARRVWLESVRALAAGLASLINVLDPQIVLLGGGIIKAGPALFRPLRKDLARFEWRPGGARVRVLAAKLGDRAGAFGAAWNAIHFESGSAGQTFERQPHKTAI